MKICSKCKAAAANGICPICEKSKYLIDAKEDDLVLVASYDYVSSFCVEDILRGAEIKYLKKGVLGSAIAITIGELSESYNFFVLAKDYDEALALVTEFDSAEISENL